MARWVYVPAPSSLKRDRDRRATRTGETCLVNVHAKSRLTPEPLRTLRPETKGQAGACPDRTRAIPGMVRRRPTMIRNTHGMILTGPSRDRNAARMTAAGAQEPDR
jgi:hypothetical protein